MMTKVFVSLTIITILSLNMLSVTANSGNNNNNTNNPSTIRSNSNNNKIYEAPWLGISATNVTPEIAKTIGLKQATGVLVTSVVQKGPADGDVILTIDNIQIHAGNNSSHFSKQKGTASDGDVILTIDNITVRNTDDVLVYLLKEKKVGDNVKLSIFRKGQIHEIELKLGSTSCPTIVTSSSRKTALDSNGVLMYDYGDSIGKVYNIVILEDAALKNYKKYITSGDKRAKESFINTSNWLVEHSVNKGNYSLWEYDFPWPFYQCLIPPYSSALAQAQGIWVLLLGYNYW